MTEITLNTEIQICHPFLYLPFL